MLKNYFPTIAIITIVTTILLIFIGVLVRATGAGLGCPDWPQCFGMWVPPTSVAELPDAYDASEFNVVKTWTEYINRLVGVLVGFLILLTTIFSTAYIADRKKVFFSSFASLILVIFQGWLGGQVVRSGLSSGMISIHMTIALAILMTLVYAAWHAIRDNYRFTLMRHHKRALYKLSMLLLVLTISQVILGTQVREGIDMVNKELFERSEWLEQVGLIDEIHRSFSWSILLTGLGIIYYVKKHNLVYNISRLAFSVMGLIILQILIGVVLAYGGLPASFQVLHLGFSAILVVAIQLLLLSSRHHR
ncbi:MAG: COX15/CtaA family protein [Cyclonatronaceae bacterium]